MEIIDLVNILAGEASKICNEFSGVFGLAGWAILIIKIVVPIILIVMGMFDMTKAIISHDDKAVNAALSSLVRKAIAAVMVFAIITIVLFLFSTIIGFTDWDSGKCASCLNHPSGCKIKG